MIRLADVTPDNWRCRLSVSEAQKTLAADRVGLLSGAYAYREDRARAVFLGDGDTPVGMALRRDYPEGGTYVLGDLFIDARYQGQGYGTAALALTLDVLRREGKFPRVILCYVEGNDAARRFYEKSGFRRKGNDFEDEIEMELSL